MPAKPPKKQKLAKTAAEEGVTVLKIISFNCKNAKSNIYALHDLMENNDILLLQEHWLFHAQLHYLQEIGKCTNYAAKGSDEYDPIQPTFLPRGHGGVAVIWKNEIDSQVRPLDDGKERIQCVEISGKDQKLLVVSVYLPSTGGRNSTDEFLDTIDQLNEIITKYQDTHEIIIGGDLNEDLGNDKRQNKRKKYLQQLIADYRLGYENTGRTFIKTNGQECSELDYFLHKSRHMQVAEKEVLKDVISNHSDHYPVRCEVKIGIPKRGTNQNNKFQQIQPTIKWDKVDQDLYLAIINGQVDTIAESPAETAEDADLLISKMHQMLTKAATESSSKKSKYKAKPKLKVWTPIIKSSLKEMRKCYDVWSRNGKPTNPADKSYQDRVNTRKEFKKQVKVEQARERDREKQEILEARTRDKSTTYIVLKIKRYTNKDRFRIPIKLKLLTGTYSLQPLRYKIYKEGNQEICNACSHEVETVEHLLVKCKAWDNIRRPVIKEIENILTSNSKIEWESLNEGTKIQILMDITMVQRQLSLNSEEVSKIEHQAKRLIFLIHSARCKLLLQP
ncbi:unnamed protein product [Mytilus edulis]|uniref:Endonuclease/exonuclease/phosphatase domain-containing protein n=1 Tax=Mytilus edulis TaxID=6550 RepID=A0A8S3UZI5_MYTED|nr:unnamed protein product [Mytilus edulis]